jgi:SAM-dependent methyltransferase
MADVGVSSSAPAESPETSRVDSNYQYWRDHGQQWVEEYDARKQRQILYHIQELMLTTYMQEHAAGAPRKPLRVLELGCGVGRHLRNLARLPDVEVHGYDQSAAMAGGILKWAKQEWFDAHVRVGSPTGRLPYEDGAFDIVYSAEVLVHVRPEHLEGILNEMMRACRGHVLHLETSPNFPLVEGEHSGCWRHDLPASYAKLGRECEVLPAGYAAHTPFRVVVGEEPRWTWPPQVIDLYRRMERDVDAGFARLEGDAAASGMVVAHVREELAGKIAAAEQAAEQARAGLAAAQARIAELESALDHTSRELEAARGQYNEMAAARDIALDQVRALQQHLAKVEAGWAGDRATLRAMLEERQRFVARASRHLPM